MKSISFLVFPSGLIHVIQFHRNTLIVVDNLKKNIEMLRDLQSEVLDTELIR
ncbi:unnamed protein product [Plutella xylostella]|uniref:(diamondback moth) hypothetical protein n=1 Tax=Plutella xylostella TaxID=51655 RepID=A0A8S4GB75_PLUXY|nr:unnamed protein product [Plutella xylostella]